MYNQQTREMATTRFSSLVRRAGRKAFVKDKGTHTKKECQKTPIFTNQKKKGWSTELPAKLLEHFLRSNKSNINQKIGKEFKCYWQSAPSFYFCFALQCSLWFLQQVSCKAKVCTNVLWIRLNKPWKRTILGVQPLALHWTHATITRNFRSFFETIQMISKHVWNFTHFTCCKF